jgi:hypothetical protein
MRPTIGEQPWEPETLDEDLPQDLGLPRGEPAPKPGREGGMEKPDSPPGPDCIDAPGSPSEPPAIH